MAEGISCCLTRLTLVMPTHKQIIDAQERPVSRITRSVHLLPETCNSNITLLSKTEYVALAASLIGVPGLAVYNAKMISRLACSAAKSINHSSMAIALLNQEQRELRGAILSNRAAIDNLFLKHHLGCTAVRQMCCFNLTDNYKSIEGHIKNLHDLVQEIKESDGFAISGIWGRLWSALWSWLPDFGAGFRWIKNIAIGIVLTVICLILLCCCIQCMPVCCSLVQKCHINRLSGGQLLPPPYSLAMPVVSHQEIEMIEHKQAVWGEEAQPLTLE